MDIADPKDDKNWMIIPIVFDGPEKRENMNKIECWTFDGHINTCVVEMMKKDTKRFEAILNYFVQKFIVYLKTTYGYVVHKKSLKLSKGKRYKDGKKGNYKAKLGYFFLPVHYRKETFIETRK